MKWKIPSYGSFKKNIFLFVFTASFLLLISILFGKYSVVQINQTNAASSFSGRSPANFIGNPYNNIIPIGTQMMIPPWIMEQYLLSEQAALYGDALNFLIYNYGVSAPSASDKKKDTYYIPLTRYKKKYGFDVDYGDDNDDSYQDTVMVDVTSLVPAQPGSSSPSGPLVPPPAPSSSESGALAPPPAPSSESEALAPSPAPSPEPGALAPPPAPSSESEAVTPPPAPFQSGTATQSTPDPSTGLVLVTTKPVDPNSGPAVPEYRPEEDLSQPYTASCEKPEEESNQTEASLPCVDCVLKLTKGTTDQFLSDIENTVNRFNKGKSFSALIDTFCKNCHGVDIGDFVTYLEERARSENVPPAIMLALTLRESNGDCNAGGDGNSSFGLFQLNTKNSTCLKKCNSSSLRNMSANQMKSVCENGKHRQTYKRKKGTCISPSKDSKTCLNNPYCNFEEAFYLLKGEKWIIGNRNNRQKPEVNNWVDMSSEDRNKWRNAIIAYNGAAALRKAESAMRATEEQIQNELGMGRKPLLDNWEIKRMFFIKQYLNARYPRDIIHNLAYVERITGREKQGGLANSSICQWIQFRIKNKKLSCK
ncbi:MAG: hypothetical protein OXM55_03545 [Bdellovibrionales bacterium]|nr:hypothetical protein [Bdellovibrionales bacterium]